MSKKKSKGKHHGRGQAEGGQAPLTPAHAVAEAEMAQSGRPDAEAACKAAIPGLEADPGPGRFTEPGLPGAEAFSRAYLDAGHSAPSPQQGPPNVAPVPPGHPASLPRCRCPPCPGGGQRPVVQGLAQHQARAAQSMPPCRRRAARPEEIQNAALSPA